MSLHNYQQIHTLCCSAPSTSQPGTSGAQSNGAAPALDVDWEDLGFGIEHMAPVRPIPTTCRFYPMCSVFLHAPAPHQQAHVENALAVALPA